MKRINLIFTGLFCLLSSCLNVLPWSGLCQLAYFLADFESAKLTC